MNCRFFFLYDFSNNSYYVIKETCPELYTAFDFHPKEKNVWTKWKNAILMAENDFWKLWSFVSNRYLWSKIYGQSVLWFYLHCRITESIEFKAVVVQVDKKKHEKRRELWAVVQCKMSSLLRQKWYQKSKQIEWKTIALLCMNFGVFVLVLIWYTHQYCDT